MNRPGSFPVPGIHKRSPRERVKSTSRLFADDCLLYRTIETEADARLLQDDLDQLQEWEEKLLMNFNPDKCDVLRLSNKWKPIQSGYTIHGKKLGQTKNAKSLGLNISDNAKLQYVSSGFCCRMITGSLMRLY